MKLKVEIGQDTPAYAEVEIDVPEGASVEDIVRAAENKAREAMDNDEVVFDASWDFSNARIVGIRNPGLGQHYIDGTEGIALEPSYHDLGLTAYNVLRGISPMGALLAEAERQKIGLNAEVKRDLEAFGKVAP